MRWGWGLGVGGLRNRDICHILLLRPDWFLSGSSFPSENGTPAARPVRKATGLTETAGSPKKGTPVATYRFRPCPRSVVPARDTPIARLAVVATLVALADLGTKQLALALLPGRDVPLGGAFHLLLAHNTGSAGGVTLGRFTWEINAIATLAAIVLSVVVCRRLAALDGGAPLALGLIAGAGLGNLTSMVLPPAGVPDFLAVRYPWGSLVFNVADIAAYVGVALSARTMVALVTAIRVRRTVPLALAVVRRSVAEVAIGIPVVVDGAMASSGDGPGSGRPELGDVVIAPGRLAALTAVEPPAERAEARVSR